MQKDYFKVCVRCYTYNHAHFIEKAMNGFCIQETDFPFVCCIVDDASKDGEQEVVKKYLLEHFDLDSKIVRNEETNDYVLTIARHKTNISCFFAVYLLKYNHYGIKPKYPYFKELIKDVKYIALCEGDDYWTDQQKLQMQYEYMESHPECTMTSHRAKLYSEKKKKYIGEQYCQNSDGVLNPVDIINRTGLYIPTCSLMYRSEIKKNYPDYCHNNHVGDYPLQITAAMKGKVYYFNKCMGVYRMNRASWIGRQKVESMDPARLKVVCGQIKMFEGFATDYPIYKKVLQNKISEHILKNMPRPISGDYKDMLAYQKFFSEELNNLRLKWKFFYLICRLRIPYIKKIYHRVLLRAYQHKRLLYENLIDKLISCFKMPN